MVTLPTGLCLILAVSLLGAQEEAKKEATAKKLPAPDSGSQARAEKRVKSLFRGDYSNLAENPKPSTALALSRKLFAEGTKKQEDPAMSFVFLAEARDLAALGGDSTAALRAVDDLTKRFEVDELEMRKEALLKAGRAARGPEEDKTLAKQCLKVIAQAIATEEYAAAAKLVPLAGTAARGARSEKHIQRADFFKKQVRYLEKEYEAMRKAARALLENASDPQDNLVVGRYLALIKGELTAALPKLALSSDALLRTAAEKELAKPKETDERVLLADAWWDAAEKSHSISAARDTLPYHWHFLARKFQARALEAYRAATAHLTGPARERAEARIQSLTGRQKTDSIGGGDGDAFEDVKDPMDDRGILVGFWISTESIKKAPYIRSLQPIFRTPKGEIPGASHGSAGPGVDDFVARPGYAVGGLVLRRGEDRVSGLRMIFMHVDGPRLDPVDSYESEWFGAAAGGEEVRIGGSGAVAIGIHGRQGAEVDAIGLVLDGRAVKR